MPHPFSIRLSDDLDARLERLARLTGRSKSFYVKHAIEDLEDLLPGPQGGEARRRGTRAPDPAGGPGARA